MGRELAEGKAHLAEAAAAAARGAAAEMRAAFAELEDHCQVRTSVRSSVRLPVGWGGPSQAPHEATEGYGGPAGTACTLVASTHSPFNALCPVLLLSCLR